MVKATVAAYDGLEHRCEPGEFRRDEFTATRSLTSTDVPDARCSTELDSILASVGRGLTILVEDGQYPSSASAATEDEETEERESR